MGALVAAATAGCSATEAPQATFVAFLVQSPFCGPNSYPLRFLIDSAIVGIDTLTDRQISPRFATTPGLHRLGASVTSGFFSHYSLDTLVTLRADTLFTQVVDLYCS